jgi:hypothetical protein
VAGRVERNCSVVGNDSSMRSARLGRVIDRGDAVYRMNFAPVRGVHSSPPRHSAPSPPLP